MKCKKCENDTFKIIILQDCSDCVHNAAYDDDSERIYDSVEIFKLGKERTQVEDDGECSYGTAFGEGCYMFTCTKCGTESHLPLTGE